MHSDVDSHAAPLEMSLRTREQNLGRMSREVFDLAVIGGGITGAGVALDAAARGLKVALIEKHDFASGTSSRSSKLIHGGLRYLEHMHFGLVRESLAERATLQGIAPHLARKLAFLVPVYDPPARSPLGSNRFKLRIGLTLYDLLAGKRNLGRHFWLPNSEAIAFAAGLDPRGLRGCFVYYDALTDDARLVIEVIREAAARGASVANYAAARGIARGGVCFGIEVEDLLSARLLELRASLIVNATGVWSDKVAGLAGKDAPVNLRPSKGVHIVVPSEKMSASSAVLIPSRGEDRFLFVIPWHGRTLIGTTDSDYSGDLDDPEPTVEEIERLVDSAARSFPASSLSKDDVISSFAGLRPLVDSDGAPTMDLSRKERIIESQPGLISVIGGKLTTYRRIAERVVDRVCAKLNKRALAGTTKSIQLAGGSVTQSDRGDLIRSAVELYSVDAETVEHLIDSYGGYFDTLLRIVGESAEMRRHLIEGLQHIEAEAVYSARYEMTATVEDFLARRTRIALLARNHGGACRTRVRELFRQIGGGR